MIILNIVVIRVFPPRGPGENRKPTKTFFTKNNVHSEMSRDMSPITITAIGTSPTKYLSSKNITRILNIHTYMT